jgi:general transcription factor 3C polypeptide 5 (transcription factor C subunit 1)
MPAAKAALPQPSEPAPWYKIPQLEAVSVEHPCVVKNVDKAIEMLGGDQAIKTFLRKDHLEKPINLKFHPEDPVNQPILSINCPTENILLKVTVPRRTGRKRKRGSNDPFEEDLNALPPKKSAKYLLQSLRANENVYQVEPVATIPSLHIFRSMPDFAYSTTHSQFMNQFRHKILPFQYPLLSDFQLNPARGLEDTEIIPPPVLSTMAYPSNYAYRQNPAIKAFIDPTTGSRRLFNTQAPSKIYTQQCHWNTPSSELPATVSARASPLEGEAHNFRGLVTILRTIFARRPIWTRRSLANQLPSNAPIFLAKYAIAYVAYAMRSGPWRDTYVRHGVDPRSDPSYRRYQTLMIQLISSKKSSTENKKYEDIAHGWRTDPDKNSHIFTGKGDIPFDGKSWQLCDLEDPLLKNLVEIPDLHIREQCEDRYFGWYQNGTWCKLKIILKAKIDLMMEGITPDEESDRKFDRLLNLPESYNVPSIPDDVRYPITEVGFKRDAPSLWKSAGKDGDPLLGFLPRNASKLELEWAAQYRALCRAPQGKLPNSGRLSKSKPRLRGSFLEDGDGSEDQGEGDDSGAGRGHTETETREGSSTNLGQRLVSMREGEEIGGDDGDEDLRELELEDEDEDEDGDELEEVEDNDESNPDIEMEDENEPDGPNIPIEDASASISD